MELLKRKVPLGVEREGGRRALDKLRVGKVKSLPGSLGLSGGGGDGKKKRGRPGAALEYGRKPVKGMGRADTSRLRGKAGAVQSQKKKRLIKKEPRRQ